MFFTFGEVTVHDDGGGSTKIPLGLLSPTTATLFPCDLYRKHAISPSQPSPINATYLVALQVKPGRPQVCPPRPPIRSQWTFLREGLLGFSAALTIFSHSETVGIYCIYRDSKNLTAPPKPCAVVFSYLASIHVCFSSHQTSSIVHTQVGCSRLEVEQIEVQNDVVHTYIHLETLSRPRHGHLLLPPVSMSIVSEDRPKMIKNPTCLARTGDLKMTLLATNYSLALFQLS